MKILIVAIPRSGSTQLLKSIGTCLNLTKMGEPFNEGIWENINYNHIPENNVIVKSLIFHPSNHVLKSLLFDNVIEFYKNYSKLFDKIILLSRKNTNEAAESYSYQINNSKKKQWHKKYTYKETLKYGEEIYDLNFWKKWMGRSKNNLEILSKELNIEIDWYEDIYSGDKKKITKFLNKHKLDLDISEFNEWVNPKHRLRQFKKTII
jgi:hypothetical protein